MVRGPVRDKTNQNSPVKVVDANVTAVGGGSEVTASSVKSDGSLWAMGNNSLGSPGLGDTTQRTSHAQVVDANIFIPTIEQPYVAETAADVTDN